MRLKAFKIKSFNRFAEDEKYALMEMDDTQWPIDLDSLFPTPEAALASIKIYDLEGKEVVIPRAEPVFSLDEMVEFFNKWIKIEGNMKLFLEAQLKQRPNPISIGKYIDRARDIVNSDVEARAMQMMLSDEAGMMNYTWEQCLEMARNEGGGAAIGGKSEPKQDEPCHVCQLTKFERRGKPCTEIRCPNQFVDRGGKSDQREGGC